MLLLIFVLISNPGIRILLGMSVVDVEVHDYEVCVCEMGIVALPWIDGGNITVTGCLRKGLTVPLNVTCNSPALWEALGQRVA